MTLFTRVTTLIPLNMIVLGSRLDNLTNTLSLQVHTSTGLLYTLAYFQSVAFPWVLPLYMGMAWKEWKVEVIISNFTLVSNPTRVVHGMTDLLKVIRSNWHWCLIWQRLLIGFKETQFWSLWFYWVLVLVAYFFSYFLSF